MFGFFLGFGFLFLFLCLALFLTLEQLVAKVAHVFQSSPDACGLFIIGWNVLDEVCAKDQVVETWPISLPLRRNRSTNQRMMKWCQTEHDDGHGVV